MPMMPMQGDVQIMQGNLLTQQLWKPCPESDFEGKHSDGKIERIDVYLLNRLCFGCMSFEDCALNEVSRHSCC